MIAINNRYNLGDKVFVITRDRSKKWFVPKSPYKIILINIQVFGHLNPPPTTQIFYKIPNEYSKKALYPEVRVFRDYECAASHCDVLNEYNLNELIIEEDGTIWTGRERKPCLLKQDDFLLILWIIVKFFTIKKVRWIMKQYGFTNQKKARILFMDVIYQR